MGKEKPVAWKIIDRLTTKLKEKAPNDHEFLILHKKNPELAEFIGELKGIMAEEVLFYFQKHPA